MTRRSHLLIAGAICVLIVASTALYVGTRPHWQSVGVVSTTIECGWDADEGSYQDHVIYRDAQGRRIGQSDAAGQCNNHP